MKTKTLCILLCLFQVCHAQESFFFEYKDEKSSVSIKGEDLIVIVPIKRLPLPKAVSITAFHQGLGKGRKYQIQLNILGKAKEDWLPCVKLGEDIIEEGITVSYSDEESSTHALHIESDDKTKIVKWTHALAKLLGIGQNKIRINLKNKG